MLDAIALHIQAAYGLALVGELRADGEFHGLGTNQDRRGAKPFRYCVHLDEPQNVYFVDLKRGISGTWLPKGQESLDPVERERRWRKYEARWAERERETAGRHAKAAERARGWWRVSAPASPEHPYLRRKGVGVHGVRLLPRWERRIYGEDRAFETIKVENVLIVPMKDETGRLWSVQAIFPEVCPALDRDKDFLPRGRKRGLFHFMGKRTETVCLAEGYATAASIHEATGYRAVVCFDAGNLPIVAVTIRGMLPEARIVVCGDNDAPDNRGRRAGMKRPRKRRHWWAVDGALPPVEGADFNDFAVMLREGHHG